MKRNKVLLLTKVLVGLYIISTIIALFIVFREVDNRISFYFVAGYVALTFFMLIYLPLVTILNSRKLKCTDLRKRILKFAALLIIFACLNYSLDYIFRPQEITFLRIFSNSLGLAFGLSFLDIIFLK